MKEANLNNGHGRGFDLIHLFASGRAARLFGSIAAALTVSFAVPIQAQTAATATSIPITVGDAYSIRSTVLNENRRIMIHLPAGYEGSEQIYPVLYLLDPEDHFVHVSGAVDFLASRGRIPPMIVVGVANTRRDRDLTPAANITTYREDLPALGRTLSMDVQGSGGAELFRTFLKTELMPWVEDEYRTADYRVLAGHSFGGLFAVDAFAADPGLFNAYIAASPSLWWDEEALVKRRGRQFPDLGAGPRWLSLSTGSEEGGAMLGGLDHLAAVLEISAPTSLRWRSGVLGGATHAMAPHQVFYHGLLWLFEDYALSERVMMTGDAERIEAHFASASRTYGIELSPSEAQVNGMGYMQLTVFSDPARAVAIFRRNVALNPESANARDSLADGLEAMGQAAEGLREREEAVRLAIAANDPLLETLRTNLVRARERFAE